jgi:hypothetical protein
MKLTIIRKILVVLLIAAPLVSYSGCKKQAKCGCGKDVLFVLTNAIAHVYFNEGGSVIYFQTLSDPYSLYYFCNPTEMFKTMGGYKSGDELLVSGSVYWECNYLYQAGNSSYTSYTKTYNIQVTDVHMDMYGKK